MAYPRRHIAKIHGSTPVTLTSSVAVAKNPSRQSLTLQNQHATQTIWIKLQVGNAASQLIDPVATADTASLALPPGAVFSTTDYTGPVAAITTVGAITMNVVDL